MNIADPGPPDHQKQALFKGNHQKLAFFRNQKITKSKITEQKFSLRK